MTSEFPCSACGKAIQVRFLAAGEPAVCKSCHAVTPVPAEAGGSPGGARASIPLSMTTTTFGLEGYRTIRTIGLVRGLTVRSRSLLGTIGAEFQTLVGGKITIFVQLCEQARDEALNLMMEHAAGEGANAVIGVRYDTTDVGDGVTEVICYGTAVLVEEAASAS